MCILPEAFYPYNFTQYCQSNDNLLLIFIRGIKDYKLHFEIERYMDTRSFLFCSAVPFIHVMLQHYPSSLLFVALKRESSKKVIVLCHVVSSTLVCHFGSTCILYWLNQNLKNSMKNKDNWIKLSFNWIQIRLLIFNKLFRVTFVV